MATKEQCAQCNLFNSDVCEQNSSAPVYDQTSCPHYEKRTANQGGAGETGGVYPSLLGTEGEEQTETPRVAKPQRMFQNPFSFKGRIRRLEYWLSNLLYCIWYIPCNIASGLEDDFSVGLNMFVLLFFIPAIWFMGAQGAKRCHDLEHSGWWQLIPFCCFWLLFDEGSPCVNKYGVDPKGRSVMSIQDMTVVNEDSEISAKRKMFRNPLSFKGRIGRLEYGLSCLFYLVLYLLLLLPCFVTSNEDVIGILMALFIMLFIPTLWFMLAQGAKRCHDRGHSGWWQFIPFYGLWMLFGDGEPCENVYGKDPKGRSEIEHNVR